MILFGVGKRTRRTGVQRSPFPQLREVGMAEAHSPSRWVFQNWMVLRNWKSALGFF